MSEIELPAMSPQCSRLCTVVQALTEAEGICTHPDLAHGLLETVSQPRSAPVFDVQVCVINGILRKHKFRRRIKRLWGRGYVWEEADADT